MAGEEAEGEGDGDSILLFGLVGVPAAGGVFLPEPLSELLVCRVILSLEATAAAAQEKRKNRQCQSVCFPLFTLFGLRLRKKGVVRYTIHLLPSIHFCPVDLCSSTVQPLLQNDDICKEQTWICGFRTLLLPVSELFSFQIWGIAATAKKMSCYKKNWSSEWHKSTQNFPENCPRGYVDDNLFPPSTI